MERNTPHLVVVMMLASTLGCGSTLDAAEDGHDDEASAYGESADGDPPSGPLQPGVCIADYRDEYTIGQKYQCNGAHLSHLGLTYNNVDYLFYMPSDGTGGFGQGYEPYEHTRVMACCGKQELELPIAELPTLAENCLLDARQQLCISLTNYLAFLINDGQFPGAAKKEALELQNWIAAHTQTCMDGLVDDNSLHEVLQARWDLPENSDWSPVLSKVHFEVHQVGLLGAYLPEFPEPCASLDENNDDPLKLTPQPVGPPNFIALEQGDAAIVGPDYGTGPISGSINLASTATQCIDPWCSQANLSQDPKGNWSLDAMVLYGSGDLSVHDNSDNEIIEGTRVELQASAKGHWTLEGGAPVYRIPAGAAHFIVTGRYDDELVTLPLPNSSEIIANHNGQSGWSFAPFEIGYRDDLGQPWTLQIQASRWR
ncbi:MAG: autotransporter outer membrane beta-barrel domain-containing protein [Myxococcales bacterium]|nr:autotransporter outer membrane beta-barrel domain-containing protein [Myxococcales bacterium]